METTYTATIDSTNRDAYELRWTGAMNLYSSPMILGYVTVVPYSMICDDGFSFRIGSKLRHLVSAKLSLDVVTIVGTPTAMIAVEDIANAPAYTTTDNDLSDRTTTSTEITWTFTETGTITSEDFGSTLQSIFNKSDWSRDNYVNIILINTGAVGNYITILPNTAQLTIVFGELPWDEIAVTEASAWVGIPGTTLSSWDLVAKGTPLWDGHPPVSCISVGYGVGSYGDYPASYGYGCGGLSCTNIPVKWDPVAKHTTAWDEV